MLVNSQGYAVSDSVSSNVYDDVTPEDWFAPYVEVAKDMGLLEETEGNFQPSGNMTRAGISENIYRAMILDQTGINTVTPQSDAQAPVSNTPTVQTSGNVIQVSNVSIFAMWKSWDADAQDDGFELTSHFKDDSGKGVYPKVNDWSVNVKVYKAEMDYNKYGDFSTHKIPDSIYSLSFPKSEVKYDTINLPYVRVAEEKVPKLVKGFGSVWIEAEFTSPTQGTFSDSDNYVSFYTHTPQTATQTPTTPDVPAVVTPPVVTESAPLTISGTGQVASDKFTLKKGLAIFNSQYTGDSNFIVHLLNSNGDEIDLIANEIDAYTGSKAVSIPSDGSYLFNVNSSGTWSIAITQPRPTTASATTIFSGKGSTATPIFSLSAGLHTFSVTHDGESNIIVHLLDSNGKEVELLANEIGAYTGSQAVKTSDALYLLEISADGNWTVNIK